MFQLQMQLDLERIRSSRRPITIFQFQMQVDLERIRSSSFPMADHHLSNSNAGGP
jgi:hypothetical protein